MSITIKMALKIKIALLTCLCSAILLASITPIFAKGRFSRLTLIFEEEKKIDYFFDQETLKLIFKIENTHIDDLDSLERYNEDLVRRIIMKQIHNNAEIVIVLKDENIDYNLQIFEDPYRLTLDLFDKNFEQNIDSKTGLPRDSLATQNQSPSPQKEKYQLQNSIQGEFDDRPEQPTQAENSDGRIKYELLQPIASKVFDESEVQGLIEKTPPGTGHAWTRFPKYIYRLDTSPYIGREKLTGGEVKSNNDNYEQAIKLANYAESLMESGHEGRALAVYQQALHTDPRIFNDDALYMWNFAEAHLGQNNLSLASGYYSALVNRIPNSTLAKFAKIRISDIRILNNFANPDIERLKKGEIEKVRSINEQQDHEAKAQKLLREAYWTMPQDTASSGLPIINTELLTEFQLILDKVESAKTAFLISSIILEYFTQPTSPWTSTGANFASEYFKIYSKSDETLTINSLKDQLKKKLASHLESLVEKEDYTTTITTYEDLPKSLRSIRKTPETAWAIGESYRKVGKGREATSLYKISASSKDEDKRIKSLFWVSYLGKKALKDSPGSYPPQEKKNARKDSEKFDSDLTSAWAQIDNSVKSKIYNELKPYFEESVKSKLLLKGSSVIVLNQLSLGTSQKTSEGNKSGTTNTGDSVLLISRLAETFAQLRMPSERRKSLKLLKTIDIASIEDSQIAKNIWAKDLIKLAEEYRLANNYLEAGRTYAFTAENSQNWEKRAEALYKGGLLLYRAGKASEAKAALQKACNDGDNLFYKNLACERLDQIDE